MEYQLIEPLLPVEGCYNAVERVLINRGIKPQDIEHYLNTSEEDLINPKTIANVEKGAKMLFSHIAKDDTILLIVDCDADGYTSAALLINYLNRSFPGYVQNNIHYYVHEGKQHGIEQSLLEQAIQGGYKLVICPDSSSNDYYQHEELSKNGIDVLIIDHHEAERVSEYACTINNQLCDYPTKSLSGVGMVYKFCSYLDSIIGCDYAQDFIDLASLGIVGDMMELKDFETRYMVNTGLHNIKNPFFKEATRIQNFSIQRGGGMSPHAISFFIAPLINGTIRAGTVKEKLLLFEAMLDFKAYEMIPSTKRGCKGQYEPLVEQACRSCNNIRNRQNKTRDVNLEIIEKIIEDKKLYENKIIAVKLESAGIDRNLTGLIANQLVSKYQHPILLLNKVDKDGVIAWEGSGRGYVCPGLEDFKSFLKDSGFVYLAEGHANAFGVGILDKDFNDFMSYSNESLKGIEFKQCYNVDFIWNNFDFNPNDILKLSELNNFWGQGVEKPYIVIENVNISTENFILMSPDKSPTLKIRLSNGVEILKFKSSQEEYESLLPLEEGRTKISIIGTCDYNEWNGKITPQIKIVDYEVTQKIDYYF